MLAYDINPDILKWARERAGYSKNIIAERLNITEKELTQIDKSPI